MRKDTLKIEKPNLLVVEGDEDDCFFDALIRYIRASNIQIVPLGGKTQLRDRLKSLVSTPNFSSVVSLGIVRDADNNPGAAFQSVCDALQYVNLPVPKRPLDPAGNQPKVAVLILPSSNSPGALEDLCLQALAQDPAMSCVEQYFECLQHRGFSLPRTLAKAKIHVLLASKEETHKWLGVAAKAGYLPLDDATFDHVKCFLNIISS